MLRIVEVPLFASFLHRFLDLVVQAPKARKDTSPPCGPLRFFSLLPHSSLA